MALYELEFPKLGIKFTMNQTAFSIGDFSIAWYGIIIAVGFLLALWYGLRNAKRFGINPDKMIDVVIGGIIGGVIGAVCIMSYSAGTIIRITCWTFLKFGKAVLRFTAA